MADGKATRWRPSWLTLILVGVAVSIAFGLVVAAVAWAVAGADFARTATVVAPFGLPTVAVGWTIVLNVMNNAARRRLRRATCPKCGAVPGPKAEVTLLFGSLRCTCPGCGEVLTAELWG